MFVELIEQFRCPRDHEEAPLVAAASRTEARYIVEGVLGCPVCGAEFPIREGVAFFDDEGPAPAPQGGAAPDPAIAMRLAAFLDLTDARGFAILCGAWGAHAPALLGLSETPLLLVNPPLPVQGTVAGIIRTNGRIPLAPGSARAAALDALQDAGQIASAVRSVRPRGRLLGPAGLALPPGAAELARDAEVWVAETSAAPGEPAPRLVSLKRR